MRFTRLVSTFTAIAAITMLAVAGCSSDDKKTTPAEGGGENGGEGTTTTKQGGNAGAATTATATGGKVGTAGATTTTTNPGAGTGNVTTTTNPGAGTGNVTTTTTPAAGAGGATTTTTTPAAGAGGVTTTTTGVGGKTGTAGAGAGGTTSTTGSTLDDLIDAICTWEFKCCDAGESKYELGPTVTTKAACKSAFVYLLHNDNTAKSPYPATLPALLTTLGYSIDPTKVVENPTGIAQCIAQWNARTCNVAGPAKIPAPTHCATTTVSVTDPCDLTNLVKPKQAAGQPCNFALNKASTSNDIECVAGTSCVDVGDADNPSTSTPTCVTRGVASAVCTSDAKCDYGFYCDTMGTGTCVAKGAANAVCAYKNPTNPVPGELAKQCMPGLTCNPVTKTCIDYCKVGYVCSSVDWACPAGNSCIPITVGNVVDKFTTCSAQHTAAAPIPRCDSAEDCGAGNYCSASSCKAILAKADTCAGVDGECPAGTYCTTGTARICDSYILNTKECKQSTTGVANLACDPVNSIGCVYKWDTTLATPAATYVCSATLLANAERCGSGFDCVSGKCEYANSSAGYKTCIAGAALGAACIETASATLPTTNVTTCAAGLTCKAGACVAQVGPGGSCESTTTAGTADGTLCKNGTAACDATQWKDASAIMCSDLLPVPVSNGGTGVSCDGV